MSPAASPADPSFLPADPRAVHLVIVLHPSGKEPNPNKQIVRVVELPVVGWRIQLDTLLRPVDYRAYPVLATPISEEGGLRMFASLPCPRGTDIDALRWMGRVMLKVRAQFPDADYGPLQLDYVKLHRQLGTAATRGVPDPFERTEISKNSAGESA